MADRKVIRHVAGHAARVLTVLLLAAGLGTAANLGATARAQDCATVDVVVARGTHEPGYLGSGVGDPLYARLSADLGVDTSAYRVNYPADLLVPSSVADGTHDMTAHIMAQAEACPDQRFVVVGYSQGALVAHGTLGTTQVAILPGIAVLPIEYAPRVMAVLLFGDPVRLVGGGVAAAYADRTGNYCTAGDPICAGGIFYANHSAYGWAFGPAVDLVGSRL